MSAFCPECYPNGIMYAGSITWKLCRSCVADESAEYGQLWVVPIDARRHRDSPALED